jgi:hypothetical protein
MQIPVVHHPLSLAPSITGESGTENFIATHDWDVAGRKNNQKSCRIVARRHFLNADYLHPRSARDIDRDSQVTARFSCRSILSWIIISRAREIRESRERGREIEILHSSRLKIEGRTDDLNFFTLFKGNMDLSSRKAQQDTLPFTISAKSLSLDEGERVARPLEFPNPSADTTQNSTKVQHALSLIDIPVLGRSESAFAGIYLTEALGKSGQSFPSIL